MMEEKLLALMRLVLCSVCLDAAHCSSALEHLQARAGDSHKCKPVPSSSAKGPCTQLCLATGIGVEVVCVCQERPVLLSRGSLVAADAIK